MSSFSKKARSRIIPSLLCRSARECRAKIACLTTQHSIKIVHIDIMDGVLVAAKNWGTPQRLASLLKGKSLNIHLMVKYPLRYIAAWKRAGSQRIFFHIESANDPRAVIAAIRKRAMSVGISLNPSTPLKNIRWLIPLIDAILIMSNKPGSSGRILMRSTYARIRALKDSARGKDIIVDIGVNPDNADALLKAGATHLVSGSAFYQELQCVDV